MAAQAKEPTTVPQGSLKTSTPLGTALPETGSR